MKGFSPVERDKHILTAPTQSAPALSASVADRMRAAFSCSSVMVAGRLLVNMRTDSARLLGRYTVLLGGLQASSFVRRNGGMLQDSLDNREQFAYHLYNLTDKLIHVTSTGRM